MATTIKVRTAWIWVAMWFSYDVFGALIGWIDKASVKGHIQEDLAVAFFVLGLWLVTSWQERHAR